MQPYFTDGNITIYHGDCREVLPHLPPESVDLILSDPPYGVRYVTAWRSRNDPLRIKIEADENLDALAAIIPGLNRLLKQDRHWYIFASPRMIADCQELLASLGDGIKNIIAWDKGDRGTVGDLESGFGEAWEACFYGMKGRRPLRGKRPRTVIRHDWSSTLDPVHPTVKPIPLLRKLVELSTEKDELILDPFMGSGTTLRAAKDLGRRAIGIEINERYCEIAAQRLQQQVLPLFEVA